ncbi:MAG: hypothetical protein U9P80_04995 [Thermodesulfobacteriota bacterium]|nr:hypothetical protein [Thermodesulfobacteriota bacterium]
MKNFIKAVSQIFNRIHTRQINTYIGETGFSDKVADEREWLSLYESTDHGFRPCFSPEEYNKALLHIFQFHKKDFCMDFSHTDGHFRV